MIIVQFDQYYHDWAYLMLRSLALHDTRSPVFADTINLSHEQVSELRHAYPHITIDNDTIPEYEISIDIDHASKHLDLSTLAKVDLPLADTGTG